MIKRITILTAMLLVFMTSQSSAQATIDFEAAGAGAAYTWVVAENASNPALGVIANPDMTGANTSATVASFTALQAGNPWALCFTDNIGAFTFNATNAIVKIMVWKPTISNVAIKFEMPGGAFHEIQIPNTLTNQWEEMTFDFSSQIGVTFSRLVIIPDFTAAARTQDNALYFDNVSFSAASAPTTSNVTFKVDMNTYGGSTANGVFVNGTFNGWCGSCNPMADADADGIWEVTLPLNNGAIEYKFTVNGWTDQENFSGGEPCTVTNGGFTNRSLNVTQNTTLPAVCWASCDPCGGAAQSNVTFKVDMSQYGGSTANGVFVNGTFNGWCGACNPMTDADGDNVWEVMLPLNNGAIEYKFTVDGWNDQENFAGGESCTVTTGGFTNRALNITQNTTLPAVCWASCNTCSTAAADSVDITFVVNAALVATSPTGLYLAGGGNFGNPGDNPMTDASGNDVWQITVRRAKGFSSFYTFTNGNCPDYSCKENIGGLSCAFPANFNDRFLPAVYSDTTLTLCFGACESDGTCPVPATPINVTFQVDMSNETVAGGVFLGGNFENWSGAVALADANGDNIWETTMVINSGTSIEWKFINGAGWAGPEMFDSLDVGCVLNTGGFINRHAILGSSDTTLPAFYFNSCDINTSTRPVFTKENLFDIAPTLVSEFAILNFKNEISAADKQIIITNAVGQRVKVETLGAMQQHRLNVADLANGLYFVTVQANGFLQTAKIMKQ